MTRSRSSNAIIPYARSAAVPMGLYALDQLIRNSPSVISAGAQALSRRATNSLNSLSPLVSQIKPGELAYSVPGGATFSMQSTSSRKKKRGKRRGARASPGRSLSTPSVRFVGKAYTTVVNTGLGIGPWNLWLGYKNTNATASLGTISSSFSNMCSVFASVRFHQVKVTFVPFVSDSKQGTVGICFDPRHTTANVNKTVAEIVNKGGTISDIKAPMTLVWTPDTEQERETKLTDDASAVALTAIGEGSLRAFAPGLICLRSDNDVAAATTFGSLLIEIDVTFSDLN